MAIVGGVSPYVRTVKTASGARAVQVVFSERSGRKQIRHVGSAHDEQELAVLKAQARRIIQGDQLAFDLDVGGLGEGVGSVDNPFPVVAQKASWLVECIDSCYRHLGLDRVSGADQVFADLVRARIIHPGSKLDSIRTLGEVGVVSASYATIKRRLPGYATEGFRRALSATLAAAAGVGQASFLLYDVTTLYFETDTPDELRKPGYSKERRVEPQILVGLLADATGFPLHVGAFEGNMAETRTMVPMIGEFRRAWGLKKVTVVADAGMFSADNKVAIIEAGLDYILSTRITRLPEPIAQWIHDNPGRPYSHGQIWSERVHPDRRRQHSSLPQAIIYYQYSHDRARRSLRGIQEQLAKAENIVAGKRQLKHNKYVTTTTKTTTVNHALAAKHRQLAGIKGYETTLLETPVTDILTAYRQLLNIEQSFRMAKSDLKARPIYAHTTDSINAHLNIVMAALAVSRCMENATGHTIAHLVRTLKQYRTYELNIHGQTLHAATPLPPDIQTLINTILNQQKPH